MELYHQAHVHTWGQRCRPQYYRWFKALDMEELWNTIKPTTTTNPNPTDLLIQSSISFNYLLVCYKSSSAFFFLGWIFTTWWPKTSSATYHSKDFCSKKVWKWWDFKENISEHAIFRQWILASGQISHFLS